ncbi:MAG: hypothetical protein EZS28_037676 [Streblomastix strix]|uniref:Reverse transcriptase domain-containing protein n=1 Tax=Streblomastix strix TaxID=222440 RepID=A0A5J4U7G1_9EUKA|nr:MAG: hypothetical protein EZS28_037676 [Streblomastix strix]
MKLIREKLEVRGASYCGDLIFPFHDREELETKKYNILQTLCEFGQKISKNKSSIQPIQEIEFLKWEPQHEIAQQDEAKSSDYNRMEQQDVSKQDHIIRNIQVEEKDRTEQPNRISLQQSRAILTSDTSQDSLGVKLKINFNNQKILFQGDQNNHWRLTSSNKIEQSAVFCRLLCLVPFLREQQVQSLKVKTENSSTAYDLNRGAAAISLLKLTDRILEVAEDFDLQIIAFHINGKQNTIPYSLS